MKLFQFAVIFHPTETEKKDGAKDLLVVEPKTVLAPDQAAATLMAGRAIPETYLDRLDQIEVVVGPF